MTAFHFYFVKLRTNIPFILSCHRNQGLFESIRWQLYLGHINECLYQVVFPSFECFKFDPDTLPLKSLNRLLTYQLNISFEDLVERNLSKIFQFRTWFSYLVVTRVIVIASENVPQFISLHKLIFFQMNWFILSSLIYVGRMFLQINLSCLASIKPRVCSTKYLRFLVFMKIEILSNMPSSPETIA